MKCDRCNRSVKTYMLAGIVINPVVTMVLKIPKNFCNKCQDEIEAEVNAILEEPAK